MKWKTRGNGALSAVTAGPLVQTPQPEAKIEVVQKAVEIPKAPKIDEDAALAIKVKSALGADPSLKMLAIDAGASGGVVTLYGTANNRTLRDKAAQVASKVEGVKSVRNELVIVAGS